MRSQDAAGTATRAPPAPTKADAAAARPATGPSTTDAKPAPKQRQGNRVWRRDDPSASSSGNAGDASAPPPAKRPRVWRAGSLTPHEKKAELKAEMAAKRARWEV